MSNDDDKPSVGAVATIVNSKAAEKLAGAVQGLVQLPHNIVDYAVGPKRIKAIADARSEAALIEARTQAEIDELRYETGNFILDREMRKTLNRRAIVAEAEKALPPPDVDISDEQPSADFVHTFFDEIDGISDPEVQKIAGRLLAGEVVRPGSFPRRTMRVLRDLESSDFELFRTFCQFVWRIPAPMLVIMDSSDDIYRQRGVDYGTISHLVVLGLISHAPSKALFNDELSEKFTMYYGQTTVQVTLKQGTNRLRIGEAFFTDAGTRLDPLTRAEPAPGFVEHCIEKWTKQGHEVSIVDAV